MTELNLKQLTLTRTLPLLTKVGSVSIYFIKLTHPTEYK